MEAQVVIFGSVGSQQANTTAPPESSDKSLNRHKCANPMRASQAALLQLPRARRRPPTSQPRNQPTTDTGTLPGTGAHTWRAAAAATRLQRSASSSRARTSTTTTTQQQSPLPPPQPAKLSLPDFHARSPQLPYFLLSGLLLALMRLSLTGEPASCQAYNHPAPNEPVASQWRRNSAGGRQSGGAGAGGTAVPEADARLSLIHRKLGQVRRELELEIMATWARTRQVALDSPCLKSADCSQGIANSHCNLTSFTCVCLPHHLRLNSSMCLAPSLLGYPCQTDDQCQFKVANSYCSQEGLCECQANYVTYRKDKCLPESKIDDYCLSDRQCQLADSHSHCKWKISFVYGRCKCPPNYMTVKHGDAPELERATSGLSGPHDRQRRHYCLPRLGDVCLSGNECLLATPNSLCRHPLDSDTLHLSWRSSNASSRRCFCKPGFVHTQDRLRCEPAAVVLTQLADAPVMNQNHQYELIPVPNQAGPPPPPPPPPSSTSANDDEGSQEFELTRASDEPARMPTTEPGYSSTLTSSASSPATSSLAGSSSSSSYLNANGTADATTNLPGPVTQTGPTPPPTPPPSPAAVSSTSAQPLLLTPDMPVLIPSAGQSPPPPPPQPANNGRTGTGKITSLGQPCHDSEECRARDPHSHCLAGRCECVAPSSQCAANSTGCHRDTFQCRTTGQCISWYFVCDRFKNCADGSDEDQCQLAGRCPPEAFQCSRDGTCLARAKVCDGRRDCADGSDEQLCGSGPGASNSSRCHPKAFACDSGECVPGHALCNAIDDCRDASDENERLCQRSIILNRKWAPNNLATAGGRRPVGLASGTRVRLIAETRVSRAAKISRLFRAGLPSSAAAVAALAGAELQHPAPECPRGSFTCSNGKCRSTAILCSGRDGCGDNSDENRCQVCQCAAP